MQIKSKPRKFLVVQTDHITGEDAGAAISALYAAGAKNVQVIPAVTKKNRTGYIFLIDSGEESLDKLRKSVISNLGSTGWHEIPTEHFYTAVDTETKTAVVETPEGSFDVYITRKISAENPELIRPEFSCCEEIKERLLLEFGITASLDLIKQKVIMAFLSGSDTPRIRF